MVRRRQQHAHCSSTGPAADHRLIKFLSLCQLIAADPQEVERSIGNLERPLEAHAMLRLSERSTKADIFISLEDDAQDKNKYSNRDDKRKHTEAAGLYLGK